VSEENEVNKQYTILYKEKLHDLCRQAGREHKSRRLLLAGRVTGISVGRKEYTQNFVTETC
jgi:hypothetical protein